MCDILIRELGRDLTLIVSDFLPFDIPFLWFYPLLPQALERRRAALTLEEKLDLQYALLGDPRFEAEITYNVALYQRALKGGCWARLDHLLDTAPCIILYNLVADFELPSKSLQWIARNKPPINNFSLIRRMLRAENDTERVALAPLLKYKVDLYWLAGLKVPPATLRWFFMRLHLLDKNPHVIFNLDDRPWEVVVIWLTMAPIARDKFVYEYLVDETTTPEMLTFLFLRLHTFEYSERAIAGAIEAQNIDVLRWWEQKELEDALTMKLPERVYISQAVSAEIREWARKYEIELCK